MKTFSEKLNINFREFILKPEYFDHIGQLHGIGHVYRTMVHILNLGSLLNLQHETRLAFFAAFIHDLSRTHDGKCQEHGQHAADFKLPLFLELFRNNGLEETDIPVIYTAVSNHSIPFDLEKTHPHYRVTALLKDADALDRVRISPDDLKLKFLRFKESNALLGFAETLFYTSQRKEAGGFAEMMTLAEKIKTGKMVS